MQGFNQGLSASNFLTAQRTLTPLFVDALTTYYILRKNRRVGAVARRPLSQHVNSLLRTLKAHRLRHMRSVPINSSRECPEYDSHAPFFSRRRVNLPPTAFGRNH